MQIWRMGFESFISISKSIINNLYNLYNWVVSNRKNLSIYPNFGYNIYGQNLSNNLWTEFIQLSLSKLENFFLLIQFILSILCQPICRPLVSIRP